jgi:hypothetical protein
VGGLCRSCTDGIKNGQEDDVDCGTSCPLKCANGKMCSNNGDCISNNCNNNVCAP